MPLAAFPKCYLDALCITGSMSVADWIHKAATLDVDGLEFYWGFTPHDDPAELAHLRELAGRSDLSIPMMCYSPDFTKPDRSERALEIARQERAIEVTAALGGGYCRVLSGQRRPDVGRREGIAWTVECITAVLPAAERHGVVLVLENHFKDGYWDYPEFAMQSDVFLELVHQLPESPWLGINYDPSNALIAGDDPVELLVAVKDRIVTMHASDRRPKPGAEPSDDGAYEYEDLLHGVIGSGLIPYDEIFAILRSVAFSGWISIENGDDPTVGMQSLAASADFLRHKMREYDLP